jgi:hypothetical protein
MCDFNSLDDAAKTALHQQLIQCADAFGGQNFFLKLLEDIRRTKPHPLTAKNCEFRISRGTLKWNKVIFKDKFTLFVDTRTGEGERGNFLLNEDDKKYKKVLNLVRTLAPVTFEAKPKNLKDGEGFTFKAFERIDEKRTRIDPLFDILFFCSVDTAKKILSYTPKG